MYINNSNGLAVFKKNKDIWNYSGLIKGLDHEIRYIYEENDGTIWINGNNNDVLKLTFKNNDFFNPKITTYDSLKGLPNQSSLAIFNAVNYLSVFSPGLGFYRHYSDKLPVGKPDHFYHDPLFPSLMPGTNDSIFYYLATRLNDSTYYALTSEQGMIKIISRRNKPIISIESSWFGQGNSTFFLYPDKENNLLWFSTFKGLYSYNLNKIKTNSIRFITTIQQIVTGKDSVLYQGNDTTLVTDIPFNKNSISLNFAALFFQGSENNTFQYYLKGLDETWSKWTKEKHITYNFLPEGTYTFIVRGKNIYGTISPQTVFKFHILPPWYRTWWAYGLYGITAFLLIIIIVIIYSKQLKSRNIKLEKLVQHRTAQIKQQNSEIELKNLQLNDINKQLEKLSLVASKIENSVLIMDSKAHFEWVNDGFIKLYGYTLEELIKEYSDNLFEYSQHPDINSIINICVNDKIPVTYDAIITNRNKQKIWTHTTLTPILDKDGNVTQIIAIDSDITHLKSIEQQLMEQNEEINSQKDQLEDANRELEKLSIVASETDNTVIIMDKDANFLWINKSLRKKYGADFENIEGKNLIDSSYNPDIKRIVAKCVSEKKTVIYETETKISSEKTIWMQTTLTPILNKNGEIKNIVAIDSDITKLKKAEEKIILQSKELENNLNELEKKNELIVNSIEYARKIQEAFLPSISEFRNIFSDSFVFIKPRDVVSGDFFWVYTAGNMKFVAVADCTGHGVPGAFMSIIGSTILNEIVREKKIYQPSQVLTMLNQGIISALHQNKELQNTQNDGMDIVFCAFNITSKKIVLATTSHMAIVCDGYGVHKINCNLFSIGDAFSARSEVVYNETEINVDKNSQIFLYSDGFHDQFGGPNNTKYMTEPFEEFLASIYKFPVDEQIKKVDKNFRAWKKENKQIDDVLVIGLKFSDI